MIITAASITDEQIKQLRDHTGWIGARCDSDRKRIRSALHGNPIDRQWCAAILNAHALHCHGALCAESHCECQCNECLEGIRQLHAL